MRFAVISDSPGSSLHEKSLKARNELISKLLDSWERLSELQLLVLEPGKSYERIPQSVDCQIEDEDRYVPKIDDRDIDGDEALLREQLEAMHRERAQIAKQIADAAIQACRESIERFPRARSFLVKVMIYGSNGSVQPAAEQKLSAAALGELPPDEDTQEPSGESLSAVDRLASTVDRLVGSFEAQGEQLRNEKADMHQRNLDLIDKNLDLLDRFKTLTEETVKHARLPPEYYVLEGEKMKVRAHAQHAAMVENVKAGMAADRQKTLQQLSKDNPNALETILATVQLIVEEKLGGSATESNGGPEGSSSGGAAGPSTADNASAPGEEAGAAEANQREPADAEDEEPYCRGTMQIRRIIDESTLKKMRETMHPDHWVSLSPLLEFREEGEFRRHINAISAALTDMESEEQEAFRAGMKASIPFGAQLRLTRLLGTYGLRVV